MPRCVGKVSLPWFEVGPPRLFNCQEPRPSPDPDWFEHRHGCDHGCRPCQDDVFHQERRLSIGVPEEGVRDLFAHPHIESRDARGVRSRIRAPSVYAAKRIPSTWVGRLTPCRNDKTGLDDFGVPICRCHAPGCGGMEQAWCPFAGSLRETCNIYLGIQWPLSPDRQTMFCTGEGFPLCPEHDNISGPRVGVDNPNNIGAPENERFGEEGPIRVVVRSERPELDQAAFVRTGNFICTSNLGVQCWGRIPEETPNCTTHKYNPTDDPYFPECTHYFNCLDPLWSFFTTLEVIHLSARFRDDAAYVDRAEVRAKNAALAWLERDMQGTPGITRLQFVNSLRKSAGPDGANGALDWFSRGYEAPSIDAAPAVAQLAGTYLRNSRAAIAGAEYVIRKGWFRMSFVPHTVRVIGELIPRIYPVVKALLTLTMGVRVSPQVHEWRGRTISVSNGENGFPQVEGGDEIIYVDDQGETLVYPPLKVEVEFDLGPFSTPAWEPTGGNPNQHDCMRLFNTMQEQAGTSLFVPAFKTNQHHSHGYDVWRGGLNMRWGFDF